MSMFQNFGKIVQSKNWTKISIKLTDLSAREIELNVISSEFPIISIKES